MYKRPNVPDASNKYLERSILTILNFQSKVFQSVRMVWCMLCSEILAANYMFKVNNINTRTRCEICSKLTIRTYFTPCSSVSIVNFEQVNTDSDNSFLKMMSRKTIVIINEKCFTFLFFKFRCYTTLDKYNISLLFTSMCYFVSLLFTL